MTINVYGVNWENRSGTITEGGTAQVLAAANSTRKGFWVQNVSDTDIWINELGNASADQPSIYIPPGAMYEFPVVPMSAISIFCATTGKAFSAREW
jgi:hypothetical protein